MADTAPPPQTNGQKLAASKKQVEDDIVRNGNNAGIPTFKFDADASPEEKAAAAKKQMPPVAALDLSKTAPVLMNAINVSAQTANGNANGTGSVPQSAASTTAPSAPGTGVNPTSPFVNGHPKAGEGNWERTGWEPRFGSVADAFGPDSTSADHQTWVESNLDEKFFGDWYHNAGIIVFSCLATWFVTKVGLGLVWVIMVLSCCGTYYRTSIRRVRRNIRDDLNREFAKQRLESDVESLEWINSFLVKFWPIYAPVISATVINTVDGILSNATPGFLDSIKLETFNLGSKPPRLEHVKTYPKTENDIVEMDWKFSFTPKDTSDMTSRQIADQTNPKIVLEVRVGKGIASKGFPIIVEDMQFSGRMKFKIKLQIPFPHIEKLDVCFLEPPEFDYALKPVGGDMFGVDIGFLPGLNSFIRDMVHSNLGPMFYAPNVFTVELAKMLAGAPTDVAIGVLQVTLHRAHGLKNTDKFGGSPDPYATISLNNRAVLAKTKTIHESADPRWNETKFIIINSFNDPLTINVFDYNDIRKDKELGTATFALDVLDKDPSHENLTLEVISNNKTRGQLVADVKFFPILKPQVLDDGTVEPVPEINTGILRYTIHQCKDLDGSKSMVGQLSPYAIPYVNDKPLPSTKIMKRTNNPIWGESREVIIGNRKTTKLAVRIKDDRGLQADPVLGEYKIKLDDMLDRIAKGQDWFDLAGVKTGRVKLTAEWKPVELKGALGGSGGYVTPIGVMRVHLQNARGLKNLESMGKSDPYVRVLLSGIEKSRTVTFFNDLDPDWDEVLYIPVHSAKEKLTFEVMDEEKMGKDRSLGHLEVALDDFIKQQENGEYIPHEEKEMKSENLVYGSKKTPKGKLTYSVSFFPCLNVADPEEEEEAKKAEGADASADTSGASSPSALSPGPVTPGRKSGESSQETLNVPVADEGASADAADLVADVKEEAAQKAADGPPKIRLTPDELLQHDCGIIVFKIIEGSFTHKDCHLEVVMDDHSYPSYTTKIKSKVQKIDDVGEAVVRELEWSKITLRIREDNKKEAEEGDEDQFIGRLKGNTFDTLKQCLNNPTVLTLRGKDGDNKIKISLKYIPIQMKLDPRESVNNMGTLRVDVLDASNLPAADRNGKSDPYCSFELNGEKVFKSKVQKKTLHPAWNEFFETKIPSRTAADFKITVYDWDMAGDDDFLGQSPINLQALEPFKQTIVNLKLRGKRGEVGDYGEIRLRFMFRSDYVTRSRQGSSTFGGTFAVPGKIVAAGAAVPLKGVGMAAGGVMKGASFLKSGFGRKSKEEASGLDPNELRQIEETSKAVAGEKDVGLVVPEGMADKYSSDNEERGNRLTRSLTPSKNRSVTPTGFGSPHGRTKSINSVYSTSGSPSPSADAGRATIRLISATGFPSNANVQARIRLPGKSKDLYKSKGIKGGNVNWDETTTLPCTADQQFLLKIIDDHFIRGDKDLGETLFVLDDTGSGGEKEVAVGDGRVKFKATFTSGSQASPIEPRKRRKSGLLRRN